MHRAPRQLLNTPAIELWPADLLRARGNRDARALAAGRWLLRRKRDGRYLAVANGQVLHPLTASLRHEDGIDDALAALAAAEHAVRGRPPAGTLAPARIADRLAALGLDADAYAARTALALVPEPRRLLHAGRDRFGRPLWLHEEALRGWRGLRAAAMRDGIVLQAISGYRSHDYQLGIFARKRARGQSVEQILAVNAAPGFSEHHSGRAIDIGTPGEPPAEESFEATPAFAWLVGHAGAHGFAMSYPRDNPHGIVHEPWHWRHGV